MTSDSNGSLSDVAARFAAVLDAEAALFDELAALMPVQRKALLDADGDGLAQSADQADTLATRFRLLETERQRLEEQAGESLIASGDRRVSTARTRVLGALKRLLRDGAVNGTVLSRLSDTVAARQAAVASLFGAAYLANGRPAGLRVPGVTFSKEG